MKLGLTLKTGIALAVTVAAVTMAQAAAVDYFGNNPTANGGVIDGVGIGQYPVNQRTLFSSSLATSQTEVFDMQPVSNVGTLNSLFGSGSGISLSATGGPAGLGGEVRRTNGTTWHGRFNTTGDPTTPPSDGSTSTSGWFETNKSSVEVTFATAVSAFGTFLTDVGDFEGSLTVEIFAASTLLFTDVLIPAGVRSSNGGLAFFGYTNTTQFNRVLISITQPSGVFVDQYDFIGFDDFITGTLRAPVGTVPEPTSLALVGLSLVLLGSARRRQLKA